MKTRPLASPAPPQLVPARRRCLSHLSEEHRASGPAPCFACARPAPPPLSAGGSGVGSGRDVLLCPTSRRRRRRVRGRGAAGRRGPRRRRRRGCQWPPAYPGAPGRSAPMPARPPCRSPRCGGGGERRWGSGRAGLGGHVRARQRGGLQAMSGSGIGPARVMVGTRLRARRGQGRAGSSVQVLVCQPGARTGSGGGCKCRPGLGLGLGSSPRAGFNLVPGAC